MADKDEGLMVIDEFVVRSSFTWKLPLACVRVRQGERVVQIIFINVFLLQISALKAIVSVCFRVP